MSKWILNYEKFRSYDQLLDELAKRRNNTAMRDQHSSETQGQKNWYGTSSYGEAIKLLGSGYKEVVTKLEKNVAGMSKMEAKHFQTVNHPIPHNAIVGYMPNVPAAIQNLPQSMITVDRKPMKRKTLNILYIVSGSASRETSYFEEAGIALLSAVDIVEKGGIQTKIELVFYSGKESNSNGKEDVSMPSICIKNYGERFSIQKVSFPLVHPSMFRRIGFKWLETNPNVKNRGYASGYGIPITDKEAEEVGSMIKEPNSYVLSVAWIQNHSCSVEEILKKLEVIK